MAVVDAAGTLRYRPVTLGRDYGDRIEVLSGLDPADVIATWVPGGLTDGTTVRPVSAEQAPTGAAR